MVNEAIQHDSATTKKVCNYSSIAICSRTLVNFLYALLTKFINFFNLQEKEAGTITVWAPNQKCSVTIRAVPLPTDVIIFLENNFELIKTYDQYVMAQRRKGDIASSMKAMNISVSGEMESITESEGKISMLDDSATLNDQDEESISALTDRTLLAIKKLQEDLQKSFDESKDPIWKNAVDKIWSFGPRRCGSNILLNNVDGLPCSFWVPDAAAEQPDIFKDLLTMENSFLNGFQLATLAGPLCDEPMMGVAFIVSKWSLNIGDIESESFVNR